MARLSPGYAFVPVDSTCLAKAPAVVPVRSSCVAGALCQAVTQVTAAAGGGAALVGAIMLGPRMGRFTDDGSVVYMRPNNPTSQVRIHYRPA